MKRIFQISVITGCLITCTLGPAVAKDSQPVTSNPAPVIALDHISLHVANVDTTIDFYTKVFDVKEIPAKFPGRHWIGIGANAAIHIGGGRTAPVPDDDDVHFAIAVPSLDPIMARLKARGVVWFGSDDKPYGISTARLDGVRQIYFKDPDGYWVEVNEALRASKN